MKNIYFLLYSLFIPAVVLAAAGDTLVFHIKNYGAVGDGLTDDGPALRQACADISAATKPSRLIFESDKTYYMAAYMTDLGGLLLDRAQHVEIDGSGSMLLLHPSNRAFRLFRVKDVTIRNFSIDYSQLPFTQGRITRINNAGKNLDFKIEDGYDLPIEGDDFYYTDGKISDCVSANAQTKKIYKGHVRADKVTALGDRTYRVDWKESYSLPYSAIGDYFVMKIDYPYSELRRNTEAQYLGEKNEYIYAPAGNIFAKQSDGILLEDIVSYACPTMTINTSGCSNLVIRRFIIKRKSGRIVAGNSDGMHLKCNESQPLIEQCYVEGTMDDGMHVKISGDKITEVISNRKVKIAHTDIAWDNSNLAIGKQIMVYRLSEHRELAVCSISDYDPINYRSGTVTFSQDIPGISVDDRIYLVPTGQAVIQNCQFETQLQRAILSHQSTIIKNCSFSDTGLGILMNFANDGVEGPPTQSLNVENCHFRNLLLYGINVSCPSKLYNQLGTPQLKISNSYFDLASVAINVTNSNGVSMNGNRFGYNGSVPIQSNYLVMNNSSFTSFANNNYSSGWLNYDVDSDGIANVVEPYGDADGDGVSNMSDNDSNNNGINDGTEWFMGRDPYLQQKDFTSLLNIDDTKSTVGIIYPTNDNPKLYIKLSALSGVKYSVFDLQGHLLGSTQVEKFLAGEHFITLNQFIKLPEVFIVSVNIDSFVRRFIVKRLK